MPHTVSAHVHSVAGGSNFSPDVRRAVPSCASLERELTLYNVQTTYESLRASQCTSAHAKEDMSGALALSSLFPSYLAL